MFVNRDLDRTDERGLRDVYDNLYSQDQFLPDRSSVFRWVLRCLAPKPGSRLLDVACGDGQMGPIAEEAGVSYLGVDYAPSASIKAQSSTVFTANGENLPFPAASFDYITNIGSLEHFLDVGRGIREMHRLLRANGTAFILVPNAFGLTWNVLRVWRTGGLADDDGQPLQRFATRNAWQNLLIENGLHPLYVLGYERIWPRTKADWHRYRAEPKEILLALLAPFLPLNAKRSLAFVCRKASLPNEF